MLYRSKTNTDYVEKLTKHENQNHVEKQEDT